MNKNNLKPLGKLAGKVVWTGTKGVAVDVVVTVALALVLERKGIKSWSLKELVDRI